VVMLWAAGAAAQTGTREEVPGLTTYWRVDATASTGGSMTAPEQAVAELKRRGIKTVINLAGGPTAAAEKAAVEAAGLRYLEFPINPQTLDPAPVAPFLKAAADPANQPVFIHSGRGHRAAALWLIKRTVVDKWSMEKAGIEAASVGLIADNTMASRLWLFAHEYTLAALKQP
jgi:uncharacterized protein (TIGR01244 family)